MLVVDPGYSMETVRGLLGGAGVEVAAASPPFEGDDVVALLGGPDEPVGEREFERMPALKVVATCSVGYDHVDLEAAARRGIWVCNCPDYCVEEMADHALVMLLDLLRGVTILDHDVRAGRWDHTAAGPLHRIAGTRLGVIGFGRIGRALAARARALGVEVWATDPYVPDELVAREGVRPAPLDELLASCAAFSIHAALTSETEGMIGEAELARMPAGSVLVNTSRARVMDFDAFLRALERGHLAGAAVDVLPVEPPTGEAPAPWLPNLIVNPHAGWYSPETAEAVYRLPVLSVRAVLEGDVPAGAVVGPGLPA